MRIGFCGGAGEVGASCILLNIDGKNIVLDCGIRMANSKENLPDLGMIQENGGVDAIIVSHAHMDHTGSLPVLSREYPEAKIYMTHATKDLVRVLLYDSLKIMEYREAEIPVFAEVHVKNMLDRILCFSPGYTFQPLDNITVTFYNASHIAGAAAIYISGKEGAFFYSGDFSLQSQKTVEKASFPKLRPDIAVIESTYGDKLHSSRETEETKLVEKVGEIINADKKILIPAFALGRAQEVILILKSAINKGILPPFKIYTDGMVNDICRVYKQNPNYLKNQLTKKTIKGIDIFFDDNIIAVTGKQPQREEIINSKEPCAIIASSGMLTGGPSQWYAEKLASDEGNYIAITGYQDEESPGRQLLEIADTSDTSERILKLGELTVPVKCGIGKFGLSAHADKTGIISLTHALSAKKVFFIHGNKEIINALASDVQREYRGQIYVPSNGDILDMFFNSPRKQITKTQLTTMDNNQKLSEDNIRELWLYILKNYSKDKALTIEEILFIWSGVQTFDEYELNDAICLVNSTPYFEAELKRPFMFHAVEEEVISSLEKKGPLEVNAMLSLIDTHFPQEAGIYKKGARFEEKIALINFNFPITASKEFENEIRSFEEITGWKVETNQDCNLSAVQNLILKLLPPDVDLTGSVSYFRNENRIKAALSQQIDQEVSKKIYDNFINISGINLELAYPGKSSTPNQTPAKRYDYQMEQNQALYLIDEAFAGKPDKVYRKSIKSANSDTFIELTFISPVIGEKYRDLLDELESRIRWNLRINPTPNQNEIFNLGTRIINEKGVSLKKNLAYLPKEMVVKAVVNSIDPQAAEAIKKEFIDKTGLELVIT